MEPGMEERRLEVAMDDQLCWPCGVVTDYGIAGAQTRSDEMKSRRGTEADLKGR